jgi:pectate lyase
MSGTSRRAWAAAAFTGAVAATMFLFTTNTAHAATVYSEDFESGTASGWSKSGGSWSVVSDGSQVYRQSSTGSDAKAQTGSTSWTDYAVEARVKPLAWSGSDRSAGVVARAQNMTNYYQLGLTNGGQVQLTKRAGGGIQVLAAAVAGVTTGSWYTLRLEVFGSSLRGYLDGALVVSTVDGTFSSGRIGLYTRYASSAFDDLLVTDQAGPGGTPSASPSPTGTPPAGDCQVAGSPAGFATVNAWGQNGTTGGAGGPSVEVDTAAELISAIGAAGPRTVCVIGMIALPAGMYDVASDKSIVGLGASSGITGGGLNIGLPIDDDITAPPAGAVHNVIIQNLVFRAASDDSVNVQMFSHHIWIDHNDLASGFDGLVDVKRGSSYVTVSWNHTHDHTKNMLLGHSDGNAAQDVGQLKVTYHHNWFDRTPQRNPRVRFGEPVHVYNNYYVRNSDTGVACQANAGCLVEGNYFEDVEEPVTNHYAGPTGRCVARNNVFAGEEAGAADCSGTVEEPSSYYSYTLDNPADVRAIVMAGAGVGKV